MYIYMKGWHVCCVQVEGGSLGGERGVEEGREGHLLYSLFTRKERIKIYKETPLSFPKTHNSDPSASST